MNTTHAEIRLDPHAWSTLLRLKNLARISLGFVWLWEGLVPKIIAPSQIEIDMVLASGWWWGSPEATLFWLGVTQTIAGIGIMSGLWERLAVMVATLSLFVLIALVIITHPPAIVDPFGGLAKDACLFACAALVWWFPGKDKRHPKGAAT